MKISYNLQCYKWSFRCLIFLHINMNCFIAVFVVEEVIQNILLWCQLFKTEYQRHGNWSHKTPILALEVNMFWPLGIIQLKYPNPMKLWQHHVIIGMGHIISYTISKEILPFSYFNIIIYPKPLINGIFMDSYWVSDITTFRRLVH
jgi:hypothetical protein